MLKNALRILLLVGILLFCLVAGKSLQIFKQGLDLANEAPFSDPPFPFDNDDLVGKWVINYTKARTEELSVYRDGKYQQIYRDNVVVLESPSNDWKIQHLPDGRMYLHLIGAKYYFFGASATSDGYALCLEVDPTCEEIDNIVPIEAYDWIGKEWVDVSGQIVLNVRMNSNGEIILLHLWKNSDRGFPIFGGEAEFFKKEEDNVK